MIVLMTMFTDGTYIYIIIIMIINIITFIIITIARIYLYNVQIMTHIHI